MVFLSPCGELVRKGASIAAWLMGTLVLFPSPCGKLVRKAAQQLLNSNPNRQGFRPLAGNWLGKGKSKQYQNADSIKQFPSPCGEWVRKGVEGENGLQVGNGKFPSPRGEWVRKGEHINVKFANSNLKCNSV